MNIKKILAAIAACAMSAAMLSMTAFAATTELDDEELDETGDEITEEITEEEEEEEEEEETEDEPEIVEVQQSPATGNSPIALAVIPVALAAAAVVAKKAK